LPDFDVTVVTIRSGIQNIRIEAEDADAARRRVQSDCDEDRCHCPPEWCTDDVGSDVAEVRQVVLGGVTLISVDGVTPGILYADDSLRRGAGTRV
jgi:hypothetical protein